jgi:hypothetical protein
MNDDICLVGVGVLKHSLSLLAQWGDAFERFHPSLRDEPLCGPPPLHCEESIR